MSYRITMQENHPYFYTIQPLEEKYQQYKKISFPNDHVTIGRGIDNAIVIPYIPLSRKHCIVKRINDHEWAIEDLSTYGIEVNGKKLVKGIDHILKHDDVIQLDVPAIFKYRFIIDKDTIDSPSKRMKRYDTACYDIVNNVQVKFKESQEFEIENLEKKIRNAKQLQAQSIILKQKVETSTNKRIEELHHKFSLQIEHLQGEKNDVENQKCLLEKERDVELARIKQEMADKIEDLMNELKKHNTVETELIKENNLLKEKLVKEREEFLAELNRENSSKQNLLKQLESKIREQEESRCKEKQHLEESLKREIEQLQDAKDKELKELEEQKAFREKALEEELSNLRKQQQEQILETEQNKQRAEQELQEKMEEVNKLNQEESTKKLEEVLKMKKEAERNLQQAQADAEKSIEEMKNQVKNREMELAALAAERIHMQAEQSSGVISSLQDQLNKVRSELQLVQTEKKTLLDNLGASSSTVDGTSKESTLNEFGQLMESELQCSICAELFVKPTTLNCSHTFCKYCISIWRKKRTDCPFCRTQIVSDCLSLVLDSFIEKMVENLTDDMKKRREEMLKEREELEARLARRRNTQRRRRRKRTEYNNSRNQAGFTQRQTISARPFETEDSSSDSGDTERITNNSFFPSTSESSLESSDTLEDSSGAESLTSIEGLHGAYYGNYGHCYVCGRRGHWAPGCPFS